MPPLPSMPPPTAAKPAVNAIGLGKSDYKGLESTLCNGCGHDAISASIIEACYEYGIQPEKLIKLSGIGCSSKSPAYFLNRSHAFNTLHGRMPSVATGALMANHLVNAVAVSGDGDTGSIGLSQFKNVVRRNVSMVYIIENNGVYGLTKGQFSATADLGQELKHQPRPNEMPPIDLCLEAIISDCGFVARSFAGDPKQVRMLIKAAFAHRGTAILDIISPCVTFNNKDDSSKSYAWGRSHDEVVNDFTFVLPREQITVDYKEGETREVTMHDGGSIVLQKLDSGKHDPTDRAAAIRLLEDARLKKRFITGLIYLDQSRPSLAEVERLGDVPLSVLPEAKTRPARATLDKLMASMK